MNEHGFSAVTNAITQNVLHTGSISLLLFQGAEK